MNHQSQPCSNPERGEEKMHMSGVRCHTCAGNGQPLIVIYYPRGVGDVLQAHNTIEDLQQLLTFSPGQGGFPLENPASHHTCGSCHIITSHVATENLGHDTKLANGAILARDSLLVEVGQRCISSEAFTDAFVPNSSQRIEPLNRLGAEIEIDTNDSLFEEFLHDTEFMSMFNDAKTMNRPTVSEDMDNPFSLSDEHMLTPVPADNNQLHSNEITPNLLSS
jgi:hypothetical protein